MMNGRRAVSCGLLHFARGSGGAVRQDGGGVLAQRTGLAAEVEFTLLDPTTLEVRALNASTGVPAGFDEADQMLTGVS